LSTDNRFDYVVLGAGIAGLNVADQLHQRGKSVAVIDKNSPGGGASGAPLVLMNPATGRRAKMAWRAEEAVELGASILKKVQEKTSTPFYKKNGVLRPALTEKIGKDFSRAPKKYEWPSEEWIRWMGKGELEDRYPFLPDTFGGLLIPNGYTIDSKIFIEEFYKLLGKSGIQFFTDCDYSISKEQDGVFQINIEGVDSILTKQVIYAVGAGISDIDSWDFLPLENVKGQTLTLYFEKELKMQHSISSMGYFAFLPETPNKLVIGSTYEHGYTHLNTDAAAKEKLLEKLQNTLPGLLSSIEKTEQWCGVRVTTQDHKPIIGPHYAEKGISVITGLGSKGMIHSCLLAKLLVDHLEKGQPIDQTVSSERFFNR